MCTSDATDSAIKGLTIDTVDVAKDKVEQLTNTYSWLVSARSIKLSRRTTPALNYTDGNGTVVISHEIILT